MNRRVWRHFTGRRVLLLQGPVGPFFAHVAQALQAAAARSIHKINFNGGDWLFYRNGAVNYTGSEAELPHHLADFIRRHQIDAIVLFGDCRPVHRIAVQVAATHHLDVWVFEEGYIRPNFVTFEKFGVNGFSALSRGVDACSDWPSTPPRRPEQEVGPTFGAVAKWAMLYYLASAVGRLWFRHPLHHRSLNPFEGLDWVRSYWRKCRYASLERPLLAQLQGESSRRYFLVPLQVAGDSQLRMHSGFSSVSEFLDHVVSSFAQHAPPETRLVVKHHPLDRGYHDYTHRLRRLATKHGVEGRLLYVHDLHLPTLIAHALGVVVVNSTVGLSALHQERPVVTLGQAIYDLPGLTFQGPLDAFWKTAHTQPPDLALYWRFRNHLVAHTQLNGSFYKAMPNGDPSGLLTGDGDGGWPRPRRPSYPTRPPGHRPG